MKIKRWIPVKSGCKLLSSIFVLLVFAATRNFLQAQARLVLGNTSKGCMVMSGGTSVTQIYLVVGDATGNSLPNTITQYFAGSGIIADGTASNNGEFNIIKWYIGNNTSAAGTYTVPWNYDINTPIPVSFSISPGGEGDANKHFLFSTYRTTWDNSSHLPTSGTNPPTNYYSSTIPGVADAYGVDRFWSVDASDYAAKPDIDNLTFTYVDGGAPNPEIYTANNNITKTDIQAQRWNSSLATPSWEGSLFGADVGGQNQVQIASLAKADLFKWWTLISKNYPLPVEWLDVSAQCLSAGQAGNQGDITIKWSTASEQNSNYFTVERSPDGTNFSSIATVKAAGNSSTTKKYSAVDTDPYSGISFYRVSETDFNGSVSYSKIISMSGCADDDIMVYGSGGGVAININAVKDGQYTIELYDVLGQKLVNEITNVTAGSNNLHLTPGNIASAMYIVRVQNNNNAVTKKVFIR